MAEKIKSEMGKCTKCGKWVSIHKKHHCYPELCGLGTQQIGQLRGSRLGQHVDGNVELAFHRGGNSGRKEGTKILKKCLKYISPKEKQIRKQIELFLKNYG